MKKKISKGKIIETLSDLVKIQKTHGNWNYSPSMFGMTNGLIIALAIAEGKDPVFCKVPKKWLEDKPSKGKPVVFVNKK